jgi:hypothetical protein
MFHGYVASVYSKCFIWFRFMLHSSVSCGKCFVFQRYAQRVMGHGPSARGSEWGPAHGAHGAPGVVLSFGLSGPVRTERGGGQGEGVAGAARVHVRGRVRRT